MDDWDAAYATDGTQGSDSTTSTSSQDQSDPPQPVYASVEEWVNNWLAVMIQRPQPSNFAWCPEWWRHHEGVARLEALWRAWEYLRLDGTTGMSVWWRDHLDPHLSLLTDSDRSPFAECLHGHSEILQPLPVESAPPGWWGNEQ